MNAWASFSTTAREGINNFHFLIATRLQTFPSFEEFYMKTTTFLDLVAIPLSSDFQQAQEITSKQLIMNSKKLKNVVLETKEWQYGNLGEDESMT